MSAREELEMLDAHLVKVAEFAGVDLQPQSTPELRDSVETAGSRRRLTGSAIREEAIKVFLSHGSAAHIHYRDWLRLLEEQGFEVVGQRPDAVFLNQLTRSPLVRPTTRAGVYAVDLTVADDLRLRLENLHAKLAEEGKVVPETATELAASTARQEELNSEIRRTQRELDETLRILAAAPVERLAA